MGERISVEVGAVVRVLRQGSWGTLNRGLVEVFAGDTGWVTDAETTGIVITLAKNMAQMPFKTFPTLEFEIVEV